MNSRNSPVLRKIPESLGTFPKSEYSRPIYRSLLLDYFETPHHVLDLIPDSEQSSVTKSHNSYNTNRHGTLSMRTLRFENYVDMTETPLRSITNSGTWMLILAPTYSTKIFIGRTVMTTYIIPFVSGMLLARDSIVGIFIPSSISSPRIRFTRSVMHHPATNSLVTMLARLIVMCITEWAQRYLSDNWSDKS